MMCELEILIKFQLLSLICNYMSNVPEPQKSPTQRIVQYIYETFHSFMRASRYSHCMMNDEVTKNRAKYVLMLN